MHGASLEAIEGVYRQRLPEFRRVAAAMLGDREAARDAVQEGFAIAVRKRRSFRGDGQLEGWLWRIVVNSAHEHARRRADVLDSDAVGRASRNGSLPDEPDARVRAALALLPERQRLALFLRYYADLDYRAIAETLGIAVGTVGVTLSNAQTKLRELLEEVAR